VLVTSWTVTRKDKTPAIWLVGGGAADLERLRRTTYLIHDPAWR